MSERHERSDSVPQHRARLVAVLHGLLILLMTLLPWILGGVFTWWIGLTIIPVLFGIYDWLFVPKGSICMGIAFIWPLASAMFYAAWCILLFAAWLIR